MSVFNLSVFNFIFNLGHRNVWLAGLAIFFAQYLPYFLILGALVLVALQKGMRNKVYLFCEGALAIILSRGILTEVIRFFYRHPRPFEVLGFTPLVGASGPSFPSGHMAAYAALAMTLWYADRKWGTVYFVCVVLIGIARVYAGVHWPLDILGGIVIALVSAIFIHWFLRKSRKNFSAVDVV